MTIGNKIKDLRLNNNLTQQELANICYLSRSTIAQYESGFAHPSEDVKNILCKYFDVTLDFLSGNTDYPYKNTYKLSSEDFVNVPLIKLPNLDNPISSVIVPIGKVFNGDYLYLYSPCDFTDARINKDDLLFIRKLIRPENGNIVMFKCDNDFFIGRCFYSKSNIIIYNSIFDNGFVTSEENNLHIIGAILEVTFSIK
jgi:transcriptional regulator with XRE-family HTH domain